MENQYIEDSTTSNHRLSLKSSCERRSGAASESFTAEVMQADHYRGTGSASQALSLTQLNGIPLKDSCQRRSDAASESATAQVAQADHERGTGSASQALSLRQLNGIPLKTHPDEDLFLNSAEIDSALRKLSRFFNDRIGIADRETVTFCLRHIFYNINQMYTLFLPELTRYSMGMANTEEEHLRVHPMPMRNMPVKNIIIQYHIWSLLQEIEATLERLESLCPLVINATTNILNELDRTCSIEASSKQIEHAELIGKTENDTIERQSSNQSQIRRDESDEWQWGLAQMKIKMSTWLKNDETQLSFSVQFAILEPMIPALSQIDKALNMLLKNAYAIFGDILPEFQEGETNEDEKATMLLLDIIQRCDQILLQIGILVEPLHLLTGQYTLETTI